jgi:gamma-glutamyl:cysteine ligase YbdK (ATP-grasp superfamily)
MEGKMAKIRTVGVELEGFVYKNREPVNVYQLVGEGLEKKEGVIKTDAGACQIELSTKPAKDVKQLCHNLSSLLEYLPNDWELVFQGIDQRLNGNLYHMWASKKRYEALFEAVKREVGEKGLEKVRYASIFSALHIHLGIEPYSQEGVKLINYLNNWAPYLGVLFANPYPSERLRRSWWGWFREERLPAPRFFASSEELRNYLLSIPKLMTKVGKEWKPFLQRIETIDGLHEGTIYWFVRPRQSYGTIEFRVFDAVEPQKVQQIVECVLELAERILKQERDTLPLISERDWREGIFYQDRKKAEKFIKTIL